LGASVRRAFGSPGGALLGTDPTSTKWEQVLRDTAEPTLLEVDRSSLSPTPEPTSHTPPRSPVHEETLLLLNSKLSLHQSENWSSPAFLKRKSLPAPSAFNSLYDPFEEDNDLVDERRRKRSRFGRGSGQWRFSERTSSPEKQDEETIADIEESSLQEHPIGEVPVPNVPEQPADVSLGAQAPQPIPGLNIVPLDSQISEPISVPDAVGLGSQIPQPLSVADTVPSGSQIPQPLSDPHAVPFGFQTTTRLLLLPDAERLRSTPEPLLIDTQDVTPNPFASDQDDDGVQVPEQPRLKPLLSAGLPLVSPLLQRRGKVSHYFQYDNEKVPFNGPETISPTLEESSDLLQDRRLGDVVEKPDTNIEDSPTSASSIEPLIGSSLGGSQLRSKSLELTESLEGAVPYEGYEKNSLRPNDVTTSFENRFPPEDEQFSAGETTPEEPISKLFSDSWRLETALHNAERMGHGSEVEEQGLIANDVTRSGLQQQGFEYEDWVQADPTESEYLPKLTGAPGTQYDLLDNPVDRVEEGYRSESELYPVESDGGEDPGTVDEEDEKEYILADGDDEGDEEDYILADQDGLDILEDEVEVEYSSRSEVSERETQGAASRPVEIISIDSEDEGSSGVEEASDVQTPQLDGSSLYANIEIPIYRRAFSVVKNEVVEESSVPPSEEIQGEHAIIFETKDTVSGTIPEDSTIVNDRRLIPFTPEASGLSKLPPEDARFQEGTFHYSLLPETALEGQESPLLQSEGEVSQDLVDSSQENYLLTPLATQPLQADTYESESVGDIETLSDGHEKLKSQPPQETFDDHITQEFIQGSTTHSGPLIGKLKELRKSSGSLRAGSFHIQEFSNIGTWFKSGKDSQTADTDDQSAISDEESDQESVDLVDPESKTGASVSREASPALNPEQLAIQALAAAALQNPAPPGFRTPLSYFAPLSTLAQYFNSAIDVFATVVSATKITRSAKGPRDYFTAVYITDPSSAASDSVPPMTVAQIFRPYKIALPLAQTGDVILLRNFKVQAQKQKPMLLSTESSAWAVFRKGHEVQIRGPEVEFGAEERGFAKGMMDWWGSLEKGFRAELGESVPKAETRAKGKDKDKEKGIGRTSLASVHELRDGTKYTDGRAGGMNGIHELRDGTVYADEKG